MSSFKMELIADSSGKWCDNAIRLPDEAQAKAYAQQKADKWTAVRDHRVVPSEDPVTHTFVEGDLTRRQDGR